MGLYNVIFGQNPASGVLLAMIGQSLASVGRFRDAYVTGTEAEPLIAVYTRNGGGNRECSCEYDSQWGTSKCKHRAHRVEIDEMVTIKRGDDVPEGYVPVSVFTGGGQMYKTGRKTTDTRYECLAPNTPECHCTGCTMTFHIPAMDGYVRDEDDDFDSTYNTAYFTAPAEWRDMLAGMVREGNPGSDWREFLDALKDPPAEPKTRNETLAVKMLADLKESS